MYILLSRLLSQTATILIQTKKPDPYIPRQCAVENTDRALLYNLYIMGARRPGRARARVKPERCLDLEIHGCIALQVGAKLIIVARQHRVEHNAHDGRDRETGERETEAAAQRNRNAAHAVEAQRGNKDHRRDNQIAGFGEINLIFHNVAHTDGGDHAVKHERDTADDGRGYRLDGRADLREEAEQDGKACRDAHHARIIDLRQREHAGVFAVGRVCRRAEKAREARGKAVAEQRAVQARIGEIGLFTCGADGGDIADVLHHGGQRDGRDGDAGADAEFCHAAGVDRETEPFCVVDRRKINFAHQQRDNVGNDDADQNGQDLHHAFAPDVAHDDDRESDKRQQPVGLAVGNRAGREDQADGNDDRAGNDGREKAHDFAHAEHFDQAAQEYINQAGYDNAASRVGQHLAGRPVRAKRRDRRVAAQERKAGAEERRYLALGDQVEQQRADSREQQRRRDADACQNGHEHRRAEHREGVLRAKDQHLGNA